MWTRGRSRRPHTFPALVNFCKTSTTQLEHRAQEASVKSCTIFGPCDVTIVEFNNYRVKHVESFLKVVWNV